jgi:hypothetical protein
VAGILGENTFCMSTYLFILVFFCCANLIVHFVPELYRLPDGVSEDDTLVVFNNSAQKVIKDAIKRARYQSFTYYYMHELRQPMNTKIAKDFHLTKEQYLLGKVDWLVKDIEAWDSLCEWWASHDFRARSDRARVNWMSR